MILKGVLMQNNTDCCSRTNRLDYCGLDQLPLAMAYVPWQTFYKTYDHATALSLGTVFPELCMPFCGKGGACL